MSGLLELTHKRLGWPGIRDIIEPPGAGPAVYSRLARLKIERPLAGIVGNNEVRVGVLVGNPAGDETDAPIGLVCEFSKALTQDEMNETRKLAWNFCRSPILITMEPHLIRVWSCYETPDPKSGQFPTEAIVTEGDGVSLNLDSLVDKLHWMYLASGQFLARHRDRFDRNQRADTTLLQNLQYVRERLTAGLREDIAHDLLARIIFVQFLFHRKDGQGNAALNAAKLHALHQEGVLSHSYEDFSSILRHKSDTFRLFKWLNPRFNGDLFPSSYTREVQHVKRSHMMLLADFVSGRLQMQNGQHLLWPHYSFDTIPLEFISSIYEEFVTKRKDGNSGIGEHYTRPFLVDFMLDKVLPWSGKDYDLKILDPCCGSAVFLVKAFQRLVHRWRNANPGKEPPAALLRKLLEENIFGVDIEANAIRVSSFSLYLAMCDEIDPKYYWSQVRFPSLREVRLRTADFFRDDIQEICTEGTQSERNQYDLIVGNAPWDPESLTDKGQQWAHANGWRPVDKQSGTLFLAKAAKLSKPTGLICMIQPAGSLLFNVNSTALEFRKKLFTDYKVDEVVNLSALRFLRIFPTAVGPACIIKMRRSQPNGDPIAYWSPKQPYTQEEQHRVVIDSQDLNWIWPEEAAMEPIVWPALTLGTRRDLDFIRTMRTSQKFVRWRAYEGFIRGKKEAKPVPDRLNLPVLEDHKLFERLKLVSSPTCFPANENEKFEKERKIEIFELPLLLMRDSWKVADGRFKAVIVTRDKGKLLLYSQSFMGVKERSERTLTAFAIAANSSFAVYYYYLTSGRLASFIPSLRKEDFETLPLPNSSEITFSQLWTMTMCEIDSAAFDLYGLTEVNRVLINDVLNIRIPDFKGKLHEIPGGCQPVETLSNKCSKEMFQYCEWFLSVIKAGFGEDKPVSATIFTSNSNSNLPYCMVAIHLDWAQPKPVAYKHCGKSELLAKLAELENEYKSEKNGSIYYRRVSRVYMNIGVRHDGIKRNIPTVFLIKPNQIRYWTRSMAMRDADEVAGDIMLWREGAGTK
ncbi:MAG TPA: N-6 DNA methylase [Sedimentisphaerales bacterium]|nr:N-6 DNA methylase [Sedimentisphaerales bacterium]